MYNRLADILDGKSPLTGAIQGFTNTVRSRASLFDDNADLGMWGLYF